MPTENSTTANTQSGFYTVVVNRRVKAGQEVAFEHAMHTFIAYAIGCPGHLAMSVLRPETGSRDYTVVARFADEAARVKFKAADEYKVWMQRLGELTEGDPQIVERNVLDEWLRPPTTTSVPVPPRYKTAVATFIGVYTLVIFLNLTISPFIGSWPFLVKHAVVSGTVVVLLAWVLMPVISRVLRPWLYPSAG